MEFNRTVIRGIARDMVAIDVDGVGTVHFERPTRFYCGKKHWNCEFQFEHGGIRYFGTVFNRDREFDLRGIYVNGTRLVPAGSKASWRDGIRRAALSVIDHACKAWQDAIERDDTSTARRIEMGVAPDATSGVVAEPAATVTEPVTATEPAATVTEPAATVTVDVTPTWSDILPALIVILQDGTETGRQIAREELTRMAALADRYVAERQA